jgi:hypothetical protein
MLAHWETPRSPTESSSARKLTGHRDCADRLGSEVDRLASGATYGLAVMWSRLRTFLGLLDHHIQLDAEGGSSMVPIAMGGGASVPSPRASETAAAHHDIHPSMMARPPLVTPRAARRVSRG